MIEHLFANFRDGDFHCHVSLLESFCLDFSKGEGFLILNEIQASTKMYKKAGHCCLVGNLHLPLTFMT